MNGPEYKVQIIRTKPQWGSGALCKLDLGESGVSLFSSPSFSLWIRKVSAPGPAVAVDGCGQICWVACQEDGGRHPSHCLFNVLNLETGWTETITLLEHNCRRSPVLWKPRGLWIGCRIVWLFVDETLGSGENATQQSRILGFSRENLQLVRTIEIEAEAIDVSFDNDEAFYVLEKCGDRFAVCQYSARLKRGRRVRTATCAEWENPIRLAATKRSVFVISSDPDDGLFRIDLAKFDCEEFPWPKERVSKCVPSSMEAPGKDFRPGLIVANREDNLFVASQCPGQSPRLHQFDPQGGYLGEIRLPDDIESIDSMFVGPQDDFYLATGRGLAKFNFDNVPIGESGVYYSRALDNGEVGGSWHRLALKARLPAATSLTISYVVSDRSALKRSVDEVLERPDLTDLERKRLIEIHLGPDWERAGVLRGSSATDGQPPAPRADSSSNFTHDLLFIKKEGRYLWLKIELASYDESARPALEEMRVFHPRLSYLRYLPATYQEDPEDPTNPDPPSRHFLERFLSLFETLFWGLDDEIDHLFEFFDPDLAPPEFLPWLASWLNWALEEELPEERRRELLRRAYELYQLKGTPAGLTELVRILTGENVMIREDANSRPVPLGGQFRVGVHTFVNRGPLKDFRLGDSSILGGAALHDPAPNDPVAAFSHRFTVLASGLGDRPRQSGPVLKTVLDEHKPAHTVYTLQRMGDGSIGAGLYLGLNTRLQDAPPFRLGESSIVGRSFTAPATSVPTSLGVDSRLTGDFELS